MPWLTPQGKKFRSKQRATPAGKPGRWESHGQSCLFFSSSYCFSIFCCSTYSCLDESELDESELDESELDESELDDSELDDEAFIFRTYHNFYHIFTFFHYFQFFLCFISENCSKMKNDDMIKKMMIYPKNQGLVRRVFTMLTRVRLSLLC